MNILLFIGNEDKAGSFVRRLQDLDMAPGPAFYLNKPGYIGKHWGWDGNTWASVEADTLPSFGLLLRHGSDLPSSDCPLQAGTQVVFGGNSPDYPVCGDKELLMLRPVNRPADLTDDDWLALLHYAQTGNERLRPPFLIHPKLERDLEQSYREMDFSRFITGQPSMVMVLNRHTRMATPIPSTVRTLSTADHGYPDLLAQLSGEREGEEELLLLPAELDAAEVSGYYPPLQSLQGTRLVRDLRLRGLTCPIVLYSYFEKAELRVRDPYDVLAIPGQHYASRRDIALPDGLSSLSPRLLEEIRYYHFTNHGKFREICHQMESSLALGGEAPVDILCRGFDAFRLFFSAHYVRHQRNLEQWRDQLVREIDQETDVRGRRLILERARPALQRLLITAEVQETSTPVYPAWRVLYLEDKEVHRKEVTMALARQNLECQAVGTAAEALRTLEEDKEGRFKVLIVDWRVFEPDGKTWQSLQGLDVIERAAETLREMAFFVLTDKTGSILDRARERQRLAIRWFAKRDVLGMEAGMNAFCEKVLQEGDLVQKIFLNKPIGAQWHNARVDHFAAPIGEYYAYYYHHAQYASLKKEIDQQANILLDKALADPVYQIGAHACLRLLYPPEVLFERGEFFKFTNKLICRRIYFGWVLQGRPVDDGPRGLYTHFAGQTITNLNTHLAIHTRANSRDQLLWEEVQWLREYRGDSL